MALAEKQILKSLPQEYGLTTISQMLLRWCDKDCGIFNTLCTLVWVFAHCDNNKKVTTEVKEVFVNSI